MTQEQKARAFDEALERARKLLDKILDNELLGFPDQIRELFPVLKESEDERIRMALIEGVSQIRCKGDVTREQMIAYLEKVREKSLIPDELVEGYKKCGLSELIEGAKIVNAINGCQNQESITDSREKQKEQKPIKMEVYEVGKGTTVCGQDYKCKKDYKVGNCWYIKDAIYHCGRDGYLTDQNGISWSCTPKWFNEYIQSNTEWAEEEKTRFVNGQFLQCKLSFDEFKEGEHYWLEYVGDDMYVGRSDNVLNQKFHITPRQLYTLFSQQLEEVQGPPQEEKQVSLNYEPPFDENPSDKEIIEALIHHLSEQDGFLTAINCVSTKAILSWLKKQKENPKSTDSILSNCVSDVKCEDIWHKVKDSLPNSTREVLCKDAIGNFFIGRYYKSTQSWKVVMYDDCDKSNEDNPPVVMWIDIPSKKQKEAKWSPSEGEMGVLYKLCYVSSQITDEDDTELTRLYQDLKREYFNGHSFENMFPKQKEQKLNHDKEKLIRHCIGLILTDATDERFKDYGLTLKDCLTWLGEQKEQKSAEWSKDDTVFLNEITDFFENKTVRLQHDIDMYAHWLKSLPEKFVFQPKQEWSDKDSKMVSKIIDVITGYHPTRSTKENEKMIAWLRSISYNLKKENEDVAKLCSNEWSEKDEKMIERLITRLNWITYNTRTDGTSPNITFFDEIDWLKSLRHQPHWKPSEEQMMALEDTLSDMPEHYKPKCTLETLLRDLKKL